MNYCFECGIKIDETSGFCHSCGAKLQDDATHTKSTDRASDRKGIIFTNSEVLAENLGVDKKLLAEIINNYITTLKTSSIQYDLLDVAGNIEQNSSWEHHVQYLRKYFAKLETQPQYLFIIGGHDVIPMPAIPHIDKSFFEKDIDTDLPYVYLANFAENAEDDNIDAETICKKYEENIYNLDIFKQEPKLNVGRLPLANDITFEEFKNYFERAATCHPSGISVNRGYGITQNSWKFYSQEVCDGLYKRGIFTKATADLPSLQKYNELHVAPTLLIEEISEKFNNDADFYFFNLHGADAPQQPDFYSEENREKWYSSFVPKLIANSNQNNIFCTGACYGARFKAGDNTVYEKKLSMLLSAIYNKTVLYFGSSRVAFGGRDFGNDLILGDVIGKSFIDNLLLHEKTAGQALNQARVDVLDTENLTPHNIITAIEFNVFGDPALYVTPSQNTFDRSRIEKLKLSLTQDCSFSVKSLYSSNDSILDEVRNEVNENIQKIKTTIQEKLYKQLNIEPRLLSHILSINYQHGKELLSFVYANERRNVTIVYTDSTGEIKSIITSK